MLTILDRYLLRQFCQVYFVCFCSLAGLYVVFDAFANLDSFLEYAEHKGGLLAVMGEFYIYRTIFFFDRTSGILALVASMFTLAWLQRHNEFTVLLAAGIPSRRVVQPIIVVAFAISLLAAANREIVIPQLREKMSRDPEDLLGNHAQEFAPRYDNETDILFRGRASFAAQERIDDPNLLLPRTLDEYGRQLVAENAFYQPPQGDRPGGYLLRGVGQPPDLAEQPTLSLDDRPVIITPRDADWLEPNECFVASGLNFEQLTGDAKWRQFSSTIQLVSDLHNRSLDFGADVRVTIHQRMLNPLLDMTLFMLGMPLILRPERQKPFLAIGLCMLVVVAYLLVIVAMQYLGSIYLISPSLAAWATLLIFVPAAAWTSEPLWE